MEPMDVRAALLGAIKLAYLTGLREARHTVSSLPRSGAGEAEFAQEALGALKIQASYVVDDGWVPETECQALREIVKTVEGLADAQTKEIARLTKQVVIYSEGRDDAEVAASRATDLAWDAAITLVRERAIHYDRRADEATIGDDDWVMARSQAQAMMHLAKLLGEQKEQKPTTSAT